MEDTESKPDNPPHRLCSEIQLFDLCDLATCRFKDGRFCSSSVLLERFEKIADEELRSPQQYLDEEPEDGIESDDGDYGDYECYDDDVDSGDDDWDSE